MNASGFFQDGAKQIWCEAHDDKFGEECGVFGVYGHAEAAKLVYLGLYALQHRGQESAGIISSDSTEFHSEIATGLVADIFNEKRLSRLLGSVAIGHNRYSTTGGTGLKNAQPILVSYSGGQFALAHNGNLVNAGQLKQELESSGAVFRSTTDSEVMAHLIARSTSPDIVDSVANALKAVQGSYSLVIMTKRGIIAVRDPHGFRPLALGRLNDAYVIGSETCALDLIGADFQRDVEPGELLCIDSSGLNSYKPFPAVKLSKCIFEFIYFSRPDSYIFGKNVQLVRKRLGHRLAREAPVDADVVIAVPDSGVPAALGYAEESGIPFDIGLIRNHYVGRTFIEPKHSIRHFGVRIKLNAVKDFLEGRRVVVVDDSIVRGTTCRKILHMLRMAGAKEVHVRISSPPTISSCFYGIDTPTAEELIASSYNVDEICGFIGADSLAYLSLDGLLWAVGSNGEDFCTACFNGRYPVAFTKEDEAQLKLFHPAAPRLG